MGVFIKAAASKSLKLNYSKYTKCRFFIFGHRLIISVPCSGGLYLDQNDGCTECETGAYSSGDTASSCTNCPEGKTSEQGTASQESDCTWGELKFVTLFTRCSIVTTVFKYS